MSVPAQGTRTQPCSPQGVPRGHCHRIKLGTEVKQSMETAVAAPWKKGVRKAGFLEEVPLKPSGAKLNRCQGKEKEIVVPEKWA